MTEGKREREKGMMMCEVLSRGDGISSIYTPRRLLLPFLRASLPLILSSR